MTTLTLKNIPEPLYSRLKESAQINQRSLNSEAIICLKTALVPTSVNPDERLARARQLRSTLPDNFCADDIDALKHAGRP